MNSKERVLRAIDHQQPDRVPCDFWGLEETKAKLRQYFGVADNEGFLQALGVDLRSVWPAYVGPELRTFPDGSVEDWWGTRRKMLGGIDSVVFHPLGEAMTVEEVEAHTWPNPDWFDYEGLRETCLELQDYALVSRDIGPNTSCVLRVAMFLRGMDKFMMDLVLNPELAQRIIAKVEAFYLEFDRRIFETAGDLIDIYMIADDFGTQSGLLISSKMLRKFIYPSIERFIAQGKRYGLRIMYHSCGAIRRLIPDLIEMGVEILNPIQTSAEGMVPSELKAEFGEALTFHGGLDIQTVLSPGSPDDVRAEVRRLIADLGAGGGFILSPTNSIMPETPVENIVAMYKAAHSEMTTNERSWS